MYIVDPDISKIEKICQSLIGSRIQFGFAITLQNGESFTREIKNCNIIGDCMENILYPFIHKDVSTFEKGPKQLSPDFYNRDKKWEYELKCFSNTPNFDISNFNGYISQLTENLERKLYKTHYLIFKYSMKDSIVEIMDFKICNIWGIINYNGKNPVSLQSKKGIWYNIRPCSFNDMNNIGKTPELFIQKICESIWKTPNKLEDKQTIVNCIYTQFYKLQFNTVIQLIK